MCKHQKVRPGVPFKSGTPRPFTPVFKPGDVKVPKPVVVK